MSISTNSAYPSCNPGEASATGPNRRPEGAPARLGHDAPTVAAETTAAVPIRPAAVEDKRGYGPGVVERLKRALVSDSTVCPDPRHRPAFVVETAEESFYIVPLSTGKVMLLARWRN